MINQTPEKAEDVEKQKNQDEPGSISFLNFGSDSKNNVDDNPNFTEKKTSLEISNDQETKSMKNIINLTKKKWILALMISLMIIITIIVAVLVTQMHENGQLQHFRDEGLGASLTIEQNSTTRVFLFSSLKNGDDRDFCQNIIEEDQNGNETLKVFCGGNEVQADFGDIEVKTNFTAVDDIQISQASTTGRKLSTEVSYHKQANGMTAKWTRHTTWTDLCYPKCRWYRWKPRCSKHCTKAILASITFRDCSQRNPQCLTSCTNDRCECGKGGHYCPNLFYAIDQPHMGQTMCACRTGMPPAP